jgi:hypothetical protein
VTPETTVGELTKMFPKWFSIGPGTPEEPGVLSWIIFASSHLLAIATNHPMPEGNQGYLVVDMDEE